MKNSICHGAGLHRIFLFVLFSFCSFLITHQVKGQAGTLDLTFNPTDVGFGLGDGPAGGLRTIVSQVDGKILIGGSIQSYNGTSINNLVRTNIDGSRDSGFNTGSGPNASVITLATQNDGKIVIGGNFTSYNGTGRNGIARLNADGSLDAGFNPGSGANAEINSLAIQSDGKIIITGNFTMYNGVSRVRIARINSDGSLDTGFDPGTGPDDVIIKVVLQSDDKVIIGGVFTNYNGINRNRVARINTDGTLDTSFDPGTGANSIVQALAIQSDGKIFIGGNFTSYNTIARAFFARLNIDGSLDFTFNPGSTASNLVLAFGIQSDGKIVVGGLFSKGVTRVNADGSTDAGFNPGTGTTGVVQPVALQSDGKILVGGSFAGWNGTPRSRLVRLHTNGSLDTGYIADGTGANSDVTQLAIQSDSKIILAGSFNGYNGILRNKLARVNADGSLDATFSSGSGFGNNDARAIAVLSDGKILIGGTFTTYNGTTKNRLARLNSNGVIDNTFNIGSGANSHVQSLAVQSDGKIIIGGDFSTYNSTGRVRIARVNSNGSLDLSFDPGAGSNGTIHSIAIQPDGKIIIAGSFTSFNGITCNRIARLNPDGSLDAAFTTGTGANGQIQSVVLQNDGKIIIGGFFGSYNGTGRNFIARLNVDGTLDSSFIPGLGPNSNVNKILIQSDGKVLITGNFTAYAGISRNRIARINSDGTLDVIFNPGTGASSGVNPIALQLDGKILIGGTFTAYNGIGRNRIARILTDVDTDSDGTMDWADCNPNNAGIFPGAAETCNGIDDNCNTIIDDGFTSDILGSTVSSSEGNTICAGESTILTLNGGTLGTGAVWTWYEGGCGIGASIGTGISITVSPSAGIHEYFVRAVGLCNATECISIQISVNIPPAFTSCPSVVNASSPAGACSGIVNYTVNASGDPSPDVTYVFTGATIGNGSGTGSGASFNVGTTSVTITAQNDCGTTACTFDVTVISLDTWYADADDDGFGDPNVSLVSCVQPAGYVADDTDCNDNQSAIHEPLEYYIDEDVDGYGSANTEMVCALSPPPGYSLNNLDCNDENAAGHQSPVFSFSSNLNYATAVVSPLVGAPADIYRFEVNYTDADGNLPSPGYPRLQLDFEGNGSYTNAKDIIAIMTPLDASDLNVTDGKKYSVQLFGLALGVNWTAAFIAIDAGGCQALQSFPGPDVVESPNVSIFADDISFSNFNPAPATTITVSAVIHNSSSEAAENFNVKLLNHYDEQINYPVITIDELSANSSTTIHWEIETPIDPAWVPMQVIIDYAGNIDESNELDNQAIRPFVCGNFALPGSIALTASVSNSVMVAGDGTPLLVCGTANYEDTAVPLNDPSVAGATVTVYNIQTGETFTGYTDANGHYCISIDRPGAAINYTLNVTVTDFTLSNSVTVSFLVLPPSDGPDLITCVSLDQYEIFEGESTGGSITVTNIGNQTAGASFVRSTLNAALPQPGDFAIGSLAPGESQTVSFPTITFPIAGTYTIMSQADFSHQVVERNENNNTSDDCPGTVLVCPGLPDVAAAFPNPVLFDVFECSEIKYFVRNNTCLPVTDPIEVTALVYQNSILVNSQTKSVSGLPRKTGPSDGTAQFTFSGLFPATGSYFVEFVVDGSDEIEEIIETNNMLTSTYNVSECLPDLQLSECNTTVSPVDPVVPGSISVTAKLSNMGKAMAIAPFVVDFELNGNHYPVTVQSNLDFNTSVSITTTLPVPNPGCNLMTVSVDPGAVVMEDNELNNSTSLMLGWDFRPGRLPYESMFWENPHSVGEAVIMNVALFNENHYRASQVPVKFEVSGPGIVGWLNVGDIVFQNVESTCAGAVNRTLSAPFIFNQEGVFLVKMTADWNNVYAECDENNNVFTVEVTIENKADYQILSDYIAPSTIKPGLNEPASLSITYENIGTSNITDSLNILVLVDEVPHEIIRVKGLANGAAHTVDLVNTWSSGIAGIHVIRAIADASNEIPENNELNNAATRSINVCDESISLALPDFDFIQNGASLSFQNLSTNAVELDWDFGDGTTSNLYHPVKTYQSPGEYIINLSVQNSCGSIFKLDTVVVPGIAYVQANQGGDSTIAIVTIYGVGFAEGSTVRLVNAAFANIEGTHVEVVNHQKIICRFDLRGQPIGFRDVVVRLPNAETYVLPNGFEIIPLDQYRFNVVITGQKRGRINEYIPTPINIINEGSEAGIGLIYITMQSELVGRHYKNLSLVDRNTLTSLSSAHEYLVSNGLDTSVLNYEFQDPLHNNAPFAAFILPMLPAGSSHVTDLYQISSSGGGSQQGAKIISLLNSEALSGEPMLYNGKCFFGEFIRNAVEKTLQIEVDQALWSACLENSYEQFLSDILEAANSDDPRAFIPLSSSIVYMLSAVAESNCIPGLPAVLTTQEIQSVIMKTITNLALADDLETMEMNCNN